MESPRENQRDFYHCFPRRRILETDDLAIAKGLQLLEAIKRIGLILAPEVVEWSVPLSDGSTKTIRYRQMRMCFTELSGSELPKHGETFGLFSVRIQIDISRQLGALPVLYMPQMIKGDRLFSSFGPVMVWMMEMARHTSDQLHTLSTLSDPGYALELAQRTQPDARFVNPNYKLNLTNTTETGGTDGFFR